MLVMPQPQNHNFESCRPQILHFLFFCQSAAEWRPLMPPPPPISAGLNLKARFAWEKTYKNEWYVIYLGGIFFEVKTRMFMKLMTFQASSVIFISWCLLKSWWKNWHISWPMFVKSLTKRYLSNCCCQCAS